MPFRIGFDTSDVYSTLSGTFIIDNARSSVKAVFPLNSINAANIQVPSIVLNFKGRQRIDIPFSGILDTKKLDSFNDTVVLYDSFRLKRGLADNAGTTHKRISLTSNNKPSYYRDSSGNTQTVVLDRGALEDSFIMQLLPVSGADGYQYYFDNLYTSDTVIYSKKNYIQDQSSQQYVNTQDQLDFFFEYNDVKYGIYRDFLSMVGQVSSFNTAKKYVYDYYVAPAFSSGLMTFMVDPDDGMTLSLMSMYSDSGVSGFTGQQGRLFYSDPESGYVDFTDDLIPSDAMQRMQRMVLNKFYVSQDSQGNEMLNGKDSGTFIPVSNVVEIQDDDQLYGLVSGMLVRSVSLDCNGIAQIHGNASGLTGVIRKFDLYLNAQTDEYEYNAIDGSVIGIGAVQLIKGSQLKIQGFIQEISGKQLQTVQSIENGYSASFARCGIDIYGFQMANIRNLSGLNEVLQGDQAQQLFMQNSNVRNYLNGKWSGSSGQFTVLKGISMIIPQLTNGVMQGIDAKQSKFNLKDQITCYLVSSDSNQLVAGLQPQFDVYQTSNISYSSAISSVSQVPVDQAIQQGGYDYIRFKFDSTAQVPFSEYSIVKSTEIQGQYVDISGNISMSRYNSSDIYDNSYLLQVSPGVLSFSGDYLKYNSNNVICNPGIRVTSGIVYPALIENGSIVRIAFKYGYDNRFHITDFIIPQTQKYLGIHYDSGCRIPVQVDSQNGSVYAFDSNGEKIYDSTQNKIQNGYVVASGYQYLKQYNYDRILQDQMAGLYDWYDANSYMNYMNVIDTAHNSYSCRVLHNAAGVTEQITPQQLLSASSRYFGNGCLQLTYVNQDGVTVDQGITGNVSLQLSSHCTDVDGQTVALGTQDLGVNSDNGANSDFTSLFGNANDFYRSGEDQMSYRMFSFNFFIPSAGWNAFQQNMYAKNQNYMKPVSMIQGYDCFFPGKGFLSGIQDSMVQMMFTGKFFVRCRVLNSVADQVQVGSASSSDSVSVQFTDVYGVSQSYTKQFSSRITTSQAQRAGKAKVLFDAYKSCCTQINWVATFSENRLTVVSDNTSFAFSLQLAPEYDESGKVSGWSQGSATINGIVVDFYDDQSGNTFVAQIDRLQVNAVMVKGEEDSVTAYLSIFNPVDREGVRQLSAIVLNNPYDGSITDQMLVGQRQLMVYGQNAGYIADPDSRMLGQFIGVKDLNSNKFDFTMNQALQVSSEQQLVQKYGRRFGNFISNSNTDQNGYFHLWISPLDVGFQAIDSLEGDFMNWDQEILSTTVSASQNATVSQLSGIRDNYVYTRLHMPNQVVQFKPMNFFSGVSYNAIGQEMLLDNQPYVKPFDMSTNLFMYRASQTSGQIVQDKLNNTDQFIAVNARKMYQQPDDEKPQDGNLKTILSDMQDTEVTLTAFIPKQSLTQSTISQVNMFRKVNDIFGYSQSGTVRVRYTDHSNDGVQRKLYRLSKDIQFSTGQDFKLPFSLYDGISESQDSILVPCKMKLNFSDLILQQDCRVPQKRDDVSDVTYQDTVFDGTQLSSVFEHYQNMIEYQQGVGQKFISNGLQFKMIGQGDLPSAMIGSQVLSPDGKYYILSGQRNYDSSTLLGGSEYITDFDMLNLIQNSASKWKTVSNQNFYDNLGIFTNYSPVDEIQGIPYMNQTSLINLRSNVKLGTSTGGQGAVSSVYGLANVVGIAKDMRNVQYYSDNANYDSVQAYSRSSVNFVSCTSNGLYSDIDGTSYLSVNVSGQVQDTSMVGKLNVIIGDDVTENTAVNSFYIYFDGNLYQKRAFLSTDSAAFTARQYEISGKSYCIGYIFSQTITLDQNGNFSGKVTFGLEQVSQALQNTVQLHEFKMPAPKISRMQIGFTNWMQQKLVDGYCPVDQNRWQGFAYLNNTVVQDFGQSIRMFFNQSSGNQIDGNTNVVYDSDGSVSGLMITVKIPGIRKFIKTQVQYALSQPQSGVLESQDQLDFYNHYIGGYPYDSELSAVVFDQERRQYVIDQYVSGCAVGDAVITGNVSMNSNKPVVQGYDVQVQNCGKMKYVFNPSTKNLFQLQVITKAASGQFKKNLYYVNLPVNNWYNMAIYRTVKQNELKTSTSSNIGFILNFCGNNASMSDLDSSSQQIFNCYTSNESILKGVSVWNSSTLSSLFTGLSGDFSDSDHVSGSCRSFMYKFNVTNDMQFDECNRAVWNARFCDDPAVMAYPSVITDEQYQKVSRKNIDLFNIGFDCLKGISFSNKYAKICLFNNNYMYDQLNRLDSQSVSGTYPFGRDWDQADSNGVPYFINYGTTIANDMNNATLGYYGKYQDQPATLKATDKNLQGHDVINRCRPHSVAFSNSSAQSYILQKKDLTYHIRSVPGMLVKNIMFVSTPNLAYKTQDTCYVESQNQALSLVNKYAEFFGNPQNRLPAVSYTSRIMNSDYATFIYNNCNSVTGVKNTGTTQEIQQSITCDYSNDPTVVAYLWNNSKITRNQTMVSGTCKSHLNWTKSGLQRDNNEYISQVGSIYNYQDSEQTQNVTKIQYGSIVDRQCVLYPYNEQSLEFERTSSEKANVKVSDKIIATAALGFNGNGYPVNGILQYADSDSIEINTAHDNYFFISQNDQTNDCVFGATQQKPVFVQTVSQNTQSNPEKFQFMPQPVNAVTQDGKQLDVALNIANGTSNLESTCTIQNAILYAYGTLSNMVYSTIQDFTKLCYSTFSYLYKYSTYNYEKDSITYSSAATLASRDDQYKKFSFIGNILCHPAVYSDNINRGTGNVFFKDDDLYGQANGNSYQKQWQTMNCFTYDGSFINGKLLSQQNMLSAVVGIDQDGERNISKLVNQYFNAIEVMNSGLVQGDDNYVDPEPSFAVVWQSTLPVSNLTFEDFSQKISTQFTDDADSVKQGVVYSGNRHAVFNQYGGVDLTGVKLTIDAGNIDSAPVYVKIMLLKAQIVNGSVRFVWKHSNSLDIDITDTYESVYQTANSQSQSDKTVQKMFTDDDDMLKSVFGIKFIIKRIVPQNYLTGCAMIKDIRIYASNILNTYGTAHSVQDVYVRNNDSYYNTSYDIGVQQFVWKIPDTVSQWKTVSGIVLDSSYEDYDGNAAQATSGCFNSLIQKYASPTSGQLTISGQLSSNDAFSYLNTYYIADKGVSKDDLTDILSNNYLYQDKLTLSWKYVDYAYISYSCYGKNASQLLDMYFGNRVFNAVKRKLQTNIDQINATSAFKDRYKFTGGISVQKSNSMNQNQVQQIFKWRSDVRTDELTQYQDIYVGTWRKDVQTTHETTTAVRTLNVTATHIGDNSHAGQITTVSNSWQNGRWQYESGRGVSNMNTALKSARYSGTHQVDNASQDVYLGTTMENVKYSSVENWVSSFKPIQIKYKIN